MQVDQEVPNLHKETVRFYVRRLYEVIPVQPRDLSKSTYGMSRKISMSIGKTVPMDFVTPALAARSPNATLQCTLEADYMS